VPFPVGLYPESLPHNVRDHTVPSASSSPSAKAESLPLAGFYSGQQPDNLAASVVDYYSGVLSVADLVTNANKLLTEKIGLPSHMYSYPKMATLRFPSEFFQAGNTKIFYSCAET